MQENQNSTEILQQLSKIAVALSANRDQAALQSEIIQGAKSICRADGASFYLLSPDQKSLNFQVISNDVLDIHMGGTWSEVTIPPLAMYLPDGQSENLGNVAVASLHKMQTINIADVYREEKFDLSGTKKFDESNDYQTLSILTIPMRDTQGAPLGVLQIINAREETGQTKAFDTELVSIAEAIASQVSVAYTNYRMMREQEQLWESMLEMLAVSIDEKSPYTSGHCQRVPILTQMIAEKVNAETEGSLGAVHLDTTQLYELNVAALLHDVGKLTTPEFVVDKATKLETISNRLHAIRARFEVLWRDAQIARLEKELQGGDIQALDAELQQRQQELHDQYRIVATCNVGNEFLDPDSAEQVRNIAAQTYQGYFPSDQGISDEEHIRLKERGYTFHEGESCALIDDVEQIHAYAGTELENLLISRGTLNEAERQKIQDHAAVGIRMLEGLPFPRHLADVVATAGAHHERLDGKGYPFGISAEKISLPARMLAMADIYEALTASDRPYKKAKPQSVCLKIMAHMVQEKHLDKELFCIFLQSGLWKEYGEQHLKENQRDHVDLDKIFRILEAA